MADSSNRLRNGIIAIAAIALSALLFFAMQVRDRQVGLEAVAQRATPWEVAQTNGKPTLVEFYADWCSTCKAMAPTIAVLEDEFAGQVNFVMLNVDNPKWMPELTQFAVNGIPHYAFLNGDKQLLATAIGEQPREVVTQNLIALRDGVPLMDSLTGRTSEFQTPTSSAAQPRDHGSEIVR